MAEIEFMNIYDLHDTIASELLENKSMAALIWLISHGRELEFSYCGTKGFISKDGSAKFVSLWIDDEEQAFDSVEQLLEEAVICERVLTETWNDMKFEYLL